VSSFADEIIHLRNAGTWSGGGTPSKANADFWDNGDIPWVSPKDMKTFELHDSQDKITAKAVEASPAKLVPAGSVLMVVRSGILAHTFPVAIARRPVTLNQDMKAITPKAGLSSEFLAYQLRAQASTILNSCTKSGTTVASVETKQLQALPFWVPSIELQSKIVEELDKQLTRLEATVITLQGIQAKLKQARASILKAAVEGRLVETEANKSNARLLDHLSSQDQHEGIAIPEGWSIHQAKTVCNSIESGTTPSKEHLRDSPDEAVPFIKVYHLTFIGKLSFWENKPTYVSKEYHSSKMKRSLTIPGDVLTNIVGPPLGKVSVVPSKSHEWNINQAIARFRCGPTLMPAFLAIYLQSYQAQSWLASTSKTTTSQVNLSISNSRLLPIPVPPFHEQEQIVAEVDRRFSVLDQVEATVQASLARCGMLRQAILKRAFGG
jgi:type I restriction enzyme S subunit